VAYVAHFLVPISTFLNSCLFHSITSFILFSALEFKDLVDEIRVEFDLVDEIRVEFLIYTSQICLEHQLYTRKSRLHQKKCTL